MPLCGVYGLMGSGKNVFVVDYISHFPNIRKYVNFNCKLPNCSIVGIKELFELEDTNDEVLIVYDEAYTEMDNRESMSDRNKVFSYLGFQSRKRNMNIFALSQLNILDIRWKGVEKYVVGAYPRRDKDVKGNPTKEDFVYALSDKVSTASFKITYSYAEKHIFPLYDTNKVIAPHHIKRLLQNIEFDDNPEKLSALIDDYCSEIIETQEYPEKLTKDWVKDVMLQLNMDFNYANFVFSRLKSNSQYKQEPQ